MTAPLLELEGSVEELRERLGDFVGQRLHMILLPSAAAPEPPRKLTIEEKLQALAAQIPLEERDKLPADLSDNLDHYIYGWPKK